MEKAMEQWVIETNDLRKTFGKQAAVAGLNLHVPAGCIYGFLGKNGAGKTTTIEMLLGIVKPDGGSASVLGVPIADTTRSTETRRRIGFVSEDKALYPYMTIDQIIRFTKSFFPEWQSDIERRYVEMFELPLKKKVGDLSKGTASKLMLLLALSRGAELLVLDEPTEGLDPAVVEEVLRELVATVASRGTTIFFSSHHLGEVEQIADSVCIIDKGRAVVAGSLDEIKTQYQRIQIVLSSDLREPVRWVDGVAGVRQEGRTISLLVNRNVEAILAQIRSLPSASTEQYPVSLKEIFLETVRNN
jgi:ABC-2 type transport system ATP-binding protein